ncbi:hypothetical protein A2715_01230 [Candidatus Woesebacteria bacterium RIFCSPHIGHO2_01_FULL_39_32]|uniref:Anti-sigma factor n=1 Tax=Candidatus Woesebacteria bacterium RIFCSPLOWO2_01_FULL_39_25 TaxID=1802521 RepID=A0A1F8BIE3_9BACT|nr:MAG: hypothetical protein A2124_05210 [Candidatus Woesebacteria bacterium GWB1_37_5]OGM24529.1 MAG: hypothetical protein A2715_01230 [Candidatus Woesebacteria bacterium RIFCSPHIGHO2_01_FULL_39_32]OGM38843.1 MAG: hypothetical protein A3F01_03635 [Candidatus Woesebacteria bacterium RIFCSPHIGHO2_12_FULL_38_11]OGM63836.1 MAG: hypothetical protein A2893_02565 [Candidatus Woesebacteria bacterium RIFCSPLOWO2_01_FULL_39_25]
MKRRDIVIGSVILLLLVGVIYWNRRNRRLEELKVPETLTKSVEETLEDKFKIEIPEDIDKAELKDVLGGTASGIATRKFENSTFTHAIISDLVDPEDGTFYQAWLVRGEEGSENYSVISTGRPQLTKGGWTLSFESKVDYSDHSKVIITLEKKADNTPEKVIIEGNF